MTSEAVFLIFVFIPFIIISFILVMTQRRFLKTYRKVVNPKKLISADELSNLLYKNPSKFIRFLKNNFWEFTFLRGNLYFQEYENQVLNKQARQVRILILVSVLFLIFGFLFFAIINQS